jgi:hypothetical protein
MIDWLPSTKIQDQTLELVRSHGDFRQIAAVPTINGKRYFIFEKPGPFSGWDRIDGLAPEEGPYPQWNLPVVRWGVGNTTIGQFTAGPGGAALHIVARADMPDQMMTVQLDGRTLVTHRFSKPGQFDTLEIPLAADSGTHTIRINYALHENNPDRPMAVLYQKLRISASK